jgi:GNAT superfamily N-acetyltransferase
VTVVSLEQQPHLARDAYAVQRAALPDVPSHTAPQAGSYKRWRASDLDGPGALPGGCMVALAEGRAIAYAGLTRDEASPGVAEHLLTCVLREWRGRGVATALKQAQIAWAERAGIHTLITTNDLPNDPMRAVNARLGYRVALENVIVEASTPLEIANRRSVG